MVEEFIASRYPDNPLARGYYTDLWRQYAASNLADRHFVKELTSGDEGKFWERAWEMLLYHHLTKLGHAIRSRDAGPDFEIPNGDRSIWIEATVPSPVDLPIDWTEVPAAEFGSRSIPHDGMLLRWTAALKAKKNKLCGYRDRVSSLIPILT
jgi:type I restriction enzyme S subunit